MKNEFLNFNEHYATLSHLIFHFCYIKFYKIVYRYPLEDRRCIYMFPDGSQAVDAKNFLVQQPELLSVTLEGQNYEGQYTPEVCFLLINFFLHFKNPI